MNAQVNPHAGTLSAQDGGVAPARRYVSKPFDIQSFGKLSNACVAAHLDLYQGYVVHANAVLDSIALLDRVGGELLEDPARPAESLARRLSFELGGVVLHEMYFSQFLGCEAQSSGSFERMARQNFGSIEQWMASVRLLAKTRGIGWVVTLFDSDRGYLHNVWVASHDLHVPVGFDPVFVLDLWEHAWLPDYGVKGREEYVEAALHAVSMSCLDHRIDQA
jgi:superoxide dismutase, Fe-Mn family